LGCAGAERREEIPGASTKAVVVVVVVVLVLVAVNEVVAVVV
jgi:hypothetical protein